MSGGVYKNHHSIESSGSATHTLPWSSRKLMIVNDSATLNLTYKFHASDNVATLFPTESVSKEFKTKTIIIAGNGDYRIWIDG